MEIIVSAPGKIILMGEHSVVYGKPAVVGAVDKRIKVRIKNNKNKILIKDKTLSLVEETTIEEIEKFTNGAREKWEEYEKTKDGKILKEICQKPLDLVKIAIGETYQNYEEPISLTNFTLEVESGIPVGRGMGSSSALAVAVVGAILYFVKVQSGVRKKNINNKFIAEESDLIFKIALEVEKRIHGNSSGVDVMASIYGGFLYYRKDKENKVHWENLNIPNDNLNNFILFDSGRPEETTGEMVAEVRKRMIKKKRWGKELLLKMEKATEKFIEEIKKISLETDRQGKQSLRETFFIAEKCLEKMGVVSLMTKEKIRKLKELGLTLKISGAGGKKGESGMLLAFGELTEEIKKTAQGLEISIIEAELGAEGIKIDKIL